MRILIAEDTKDMNRVLTVALEHEGYTVDSAFDGVEASEYIENNGYDAVILDIMMPKKDGIAVLRDMRSSHIVTPVLMLTAKAEIDDRVAGLDAGADDYLSKPFAMKELLARVRAMVRRKKEYEPEVISFKDLKLDSGTCEIKCENAVRLSVKEFELLQQFIRNDGRELDAKYLLDTVWNDNRDAEEDTVWLYIMYLKRKLRAVSSCVTIEGTKNTAYRLVSAEES